MPTDSPLSDLDQEREAANRGMTLIDSGKSKQRDTAIYFPHQWVRQILEMIASGNLSLFDPDPLSKKKVFRERRIRNS